MAVLKKDTITIKRKVFTKEDTDKLIDLIAANWKARPTYQGRDPSQYFSIDVKFQDGSTSSISDIQSVPDIKTELTLKKPQGIAFTYEDRKHTSKIYVYLSETVGLGNYYSTINNIVIQSEHKTWYDSKRTQFSDYLNLVQNQDNFYLKYKQVIDFLLN